MASSNRTESQRVLVVDDMKMNRRVAERALDKLGYDHGSATNGVEAVERYGEGDWDAVLMDCRMPEMDGYEATRQIRRIESESGEHVAILAVTADGERKACIDAGMDDYMAKPLDIPALGEKLADLLARRRARG